MAQQRTVFPAGVDKRAFTAFLREAQQELTRDARLFHDANVKRGKELIRSAVGSSRLLKVSRKDSKALLDAHLESKAHKQTVKARKRPRALNGHNPARYAPYAFPWSYLNAGGIGGASLYTPNAQYGSLGANLQDYFGGSGSAATAMGFWYQAQHRGNLFASAQIYISGAAEVYAFPGYANANAFVKVFVQQWQPSWSLSAQSTIWDRSEYAFGIDADSDINGYYSASITVPIIAGGWYCLWGALYQHVTAGGIASAVSNFQGTIGPITYIEV